MRKSLVQLLAVLVVGVSLFAASSRADEYTIDEGHAGVTFKISHLGLSWTYGRFNELSGAFRVDPDVSKSAFVMNIKSDSIDTANKKRDDHLRSPDFFNTKQYPLITFQSKSVKAIDGGYEVSGDMAMHGVTKPITFNLKGGRTAEFPKGVNRIGYVTEFTLKRSEFGIDKMVGPLGDDVHVSISFEGVKK